MEVCSAATTTLSPCWWSPTRAAVVVVMSTQICCLPSFTSSCYMHPAPSDTILLMVCAAAAIILQVQKIGGLVCDFDADLVLVALWVTQVAHCAGQEFRLQICTWGPSSLECIR